MAPLIPYRAKDIYIKLVKIKTMFGPITDHYSSELAEHTTQTIIKIIYEAT